VVSTASGADGNVILGSPGRVNRPTRAKCPDHQVVLPGAGRREARMDTNPITKQLRAIWGKFVPQKSYGVLVNTTAGVRVVSVPAGRMPRRSTRRD
jgi:hypothetical protein